ncbi:MAG: tetraacyldisaccharide 4'-kinase [Gemmatimonadota bacterium]
MRAGVELFARRWWAGGYGVPGRILSAAAMPLSWAWTVLARSAGERAADRAVRVEGLTVASVGNLAVGGTGKTPVVSWLTERLRRAGRQPGILVGGHAPDEAALHASRLPDVPVLEGRDRVASAREAARRGCGVAVLDDGFQHRRLQRDLDVVLLAAEDPFPAPVLPAGPYREGVGGLRRADAVLVTRRSADVASSRDLAGRVERVAPGLVVGGVHLAPAGWRELGGRSTDAPPGDVLAVCAVGRPGAFRSSVEKTTSGSVELVAFADHHVYTPADLAGLEHRAGRRSIVTTEKDAVKLRRLSGTPGRMYVLTEEVRWDWGEHDFLSRLNDLGVRAGAE